MANKILKGAEAKLYVGGKLIGTFKDVELNMNKTGIIVDELVKTESSNVASVAYQDQQKKAFVTFTNGGVYEYENVDREDFESLRDAESVGRHLRNVFLKKGFEYKKLENTKLLKAMTEEEADKLVASGEASYGKKVEVGGTLTQEVIEEAAKKCEDDFGKVE